MVVQSCKRMVFFWWCPCHILILRGVYGCVNRVLKSGSPQWCSLKIRATWRHRSAGRISLFKKSYIRLVVWMNFNDCMYSCCFGFSFDPLNIKVNNPCFIELWTWLYFDSSLAINCWNIKYGIQKAYKNNALLISSEYHMPRSENLSL